MNKKELEKYIVETYRTEAEFPWAKYPEYVVFRHTNNQKWFALVMTVAGNQIGLPQTVRMDILNVKCEPSVIGSFLKQNGFFPAYHMSKSNWISIALDGSVGDETIKMLLDRSYELTSPKNGRKS